MEQFSSNAFTDLPTGFSCCRQGWILRSSVCSPWSFPLFLVVPKHSIDSVQQSYLRTQLLFGSRSNSMVPFIYFIQAFLEQLVPDITELILTMSDWSTYGWQPGCIQPRLDSRAWHWSDNELVRFMMQGLGNQGTLVNVNRKIFLILPTL